MFVVDASVAVKLFLAEEDAASARRFFGPSSGRLIAPDLLTVECANIFWRSAKTGRISRTEARSHLRNLLDLGLSMVPVEDIASRGLEIALDHGLTAYDAAYLAVSEVEALPLITADEKLYRKVTGTPFDVRLLSQVTG